MKKCCWCNGNDNECSCNYTSLCKKCGTFHYRGGDCPDLESLL